MDCEYSGIFGFSLFLLSMMIPVLFFIISIVLINNFLVNHKNGDTK